MNITEHEMRGLLTGKCIPGDMRVNEELAAYLVRRFSEQQQKLDAVVAENVALKKIAMDYANLADSRLSEMTADCESDCRRECYEFTNFTPATQSILNAVRADAVRQVVHEADGYEKQFQRDLTPAEWRTLVVNYFGAFDGLSRPVDAAKDGV